MADVKFTGSCECGHCTYTCNTFPNDSGECHCITCQKLSGSSSMSFIPVPTSSLTWTNEPTIMKNTTIAQRSGCIHCHSWMAMKYYSTLDRISLNISTIHTDVPSHGDLQKFIPTHHIFVAQKAIWSPINDDLPQYDRFRGDSHRIEK